MIRLIELKKEELLENFSWNLYPKGPRPGQINFWGPIVETKPPWILEGPTGIGKTEAAHAFLKTLEKKGLSPLFHIAITKSQVDQVKKWYPEVKVVYGRNEYPCLFYCPYHRGIKKDLKPEACTTMSECQKCPYFQEGIVISAEDSPCSIIDCPHRVSQITGETKEPGVEPCPYQLAKYEAKQGGIVVCTVAFYLVVRLFHPEEWPTPAGLVIEEAHRIARMARNCLKWEITDYHLKRLIELLGKIKAPERPILISFLRTAAKIVRSKKGEGPFLLKDEEIRELLNILLEFHYPEKLFERMREAVKEGLIDPFEDVKTLKALERLAYEIPRYIKGFEYSLPTEKRGPLNITYGFCRKELKPRQRFRYELVIQAYHVAPIFKKIIPPLTLAYSATIGDPKIFAWETGIEGTFHSFPSEFPVKNTRIFMPIDTPNLAKKVRRKGDLKKMLKKIAETCKRLAEINIRALVVVTSDKERKKFIEYCQRLGINCLSYDEKKKPKEALAEFKKGEGQVLLGTSAAYGEGIDLPKKLAPVIFFLRPGYPKPKDPMNEFEHRKWGDVRAWKLKNYRVMIEALQVRGRNIRNPDDVGVTIFIDQRFRKFLYPNLPEWLKEAYVRDLTFDQAVEEAIQLVK
jgi:Rad3-related DNA helicase